MKRLLAIVLIVLVPEAFLAAESSAGAGAIYYGDITARGESGSGFEALCFGGELRWQYGFLRLDAAGFYLPGPPDGDSGVFLVPLDAGLSLDLFFMRFGLLAGADLCFGKGTAYYPEMMGTVNYNLKASLDFLISRRLSLGLEGYYFFGAFKTLGTAIGKGPPMMAAYLALRF